MKLIAKTLSAIVVFGVVTAGQAVAKVPSDAVNNYPFISADRVADSIDLNKLSETPRANKNPFKNASTPKRSDQGKVAAIEKLKKLSTYPF